MFSRVFVAGCALIYASVGVACLVWPSEVLGEVGIQSTDAIGVIELRAMYGGLELGLAVFLGWCLVAGQTRAGVMAAWLSIGGLGLARGGAWLAMGMPDSLHPWLFLAEGTALVLGPVALWTLTASDEAAST